MVLEARRFDSLLIGTQKSSLCFLQVFMVENKRKHLLQKPLNMEINVWFSAYSKCFFTISKMCIKKFWPLYFHKKNIHSNITEKKIQKCLSNLFCFVKKKIFCKYMCVRFRFCISVKKTNMLQVTIHTSSKMCCKNRYVLQDMIYTTQLKKEIYILADFVQWLHLKYFYKVNGYISGV